MKEDGRGMAMRPMVDTGPLAMRALIGCCIAMFLNPSSLVLLTFGVYLLPIVKDTGWSRDVVSGSISAAMLMIALSPPLIGYLLNRFGINRVSRIGFPLCGAAIMLLAIPQTPVMFVATLAVVGLLMSGQTSIAYIFCLSGWFDRRRGFALGLGLASTGFALIILPPVAAQLIAHIGWRGSYAVLGLVVMLIAFPVSRRMILDPPVTAVAVRADIPGLPWRQAFRTRVFWLLFASILLLGCAVSAGMINLTILLIGRGVAPERASFVLALVGIAMIVARLVCGALFDRVRAPWVTGSICIVVAAAFVVLASSSDAVGVMIAAVLIGIGFGAEGDALSYMASRAFGMRDFGTIFGVVFLAFTGGGATGPLIFAVLRAHYGNYDVALWLAGAACLLAAILTLLIRDADLPFARERRVTADLDRAVPAGAA